MAVFTKDGLLTYIDGDGNEYQLFPVTQIKQVLGLVDALAGKAPEGFGLGKTVAQHELNVDNAVAMGWHQVKNVIIPGFSEDPDRWWDVFVITNMDNFSTHQFIFDRYANFSTNGASYLHRSRADGGAWGEWRWVDPPMQLNWEYRTSEHIANKSVYKRYNGTTIEYRLDGETTWKTFAELYGAAPAGYGLGGACIDVDSWDNATENGWYRSSGNAHINGRTYGHVTKHADNWIIQEAWQIDDVGNLIYKAVRSKIAGVWKPWEWDNPPMVPGVEYRTTERWDGKAVYTKLIDFGALPNATSKIINHGLGDITTLSISMFCTKSDWCFCLPGNTENEPSVLFSRDNIQVITTVDRSAYNGYATVRYLKN